MWRLRSASSVGAVVEIGPQDKVNALFGTFGPWARVPLKGDRKAGEMLAGIEVKKSAQVSTQGSTFGLAAHFNPAQNQTH